MVDVDGGRGGCKGGGVLGFIYGLDRSFTEPRPIAVKFGAP
jgi:hypothetical protein